jgi:hypothetical protein
MFGIQYLCVIIAVHANLFVWFDPAIGPLYWALFCHHAVWQMPIMNAMFAKCHHLRMIGSEYTAQVA